MLGDHRFYQFLPNHNWSCWIALNGNLEVIHSKLFFPVFSGSYQWTSSTCLNSGSSSLQSLYWVNSLYYSFFSLSLILFFLHYSHVIRSYFLKNRALKRPKLTFSLYSNWRSSETWPVAFARDIKKFSHQLISYVNSLL